MSPTPSLDGEIIGTYRPPKTYYQPPKTTYKPPKQYYREEPYQNTGGGISDAERQRAINEAQARERARLIAEAQARARADAQRKLEARNWYKAIQDFKNKDSGKLPYTNYYDARAIRDKINKYYNPRDWVVNKTTNMPEYIGNYPKAGITDFAALGAGYIANSAVSGYNNLKNWWDIKSENPPENLKFLQTASPNNIMPYNPMLGLYPTNQGSTNINNMSNDQTLTSERITSTTASGNKTSTGSTEGSTAGHMTAEEQKAWDDAMQNERISKYEQAFPDIKSEKDYYKYVYDTDNPKSKLTRLTRYIDGIPIEFYTWRGIDGNLADIAAPMGYNTPNQRNYVDAWSDARLPIPVDAIFPEGTLPSGGGGGGEEYYEYPDYGGGGGFSFGGGGGGGGYYGNAYNEALKHFSTLVKWVI